MATTRESGKSSAPVVGLEATTGRKVEKSVGTGQLSVEDKGFLHLSGDDTGDGRPPRPSPDLVGDTGIESVTSTLCPTH